MLDRKRQGSDGLKELFPDGRLGSPVREGEKKGEEERGVKGMGLERGQRRRRLE